MRYYSRAMQSSERFKNAILANMLKGIKERGIASGSISLLERKRRIKSSADVAMALARGPAAKWSHGIIGNNQKRSVSVGAVAGGGMVKQLYRCGMTGNSEKILKRRSMRRRYGMKSRRRKGGRWWSDGLSSTTRVVVKRKLQVLKRLVPGGETMDDREVVDEALDYVVSLRAQLHVMRCLTSAAEFLK